MPPATTDLYRSITAADKATARATLTGVKMGVDNGAGTAAAKKQKWADVLQTMMDKLPDGANTISGLRRPEREASIDYMTSKAVNLIAMLVKMTTASGGISVSDVTWPAAPGGGPDPMFDPLDMADGLPDMPKQKLKIAQAEEDDEAAGAARQNEFAKTRTYEAGKAARSAGSRRRWRCG